VGFTDGAAFWHRLKAKRKRAQEKGRELCCPLCPLTHLDPGWRELWPYTWILGDANPTLGRKPAKIPQIRAPKWPQIRAPQWPQNAPILGEKPLNTPTCPFQSDLKPSYPPNPIQWVAGGGGGGGAVSYQRLSFMFLNLLYCLCGRRSDFPIWTLNPFFSIGASTDCHSTQCAI